MARSSQYVLLFKKLVEATELDDHEQFERQIEDIRSQMHHLEEGERFDLDINIKAESKSYYDRLL